MLSRNLRGFWTQWIIDVLNEAFCSTWIRTRSFQFTPPSQKLSSQILIYIVFPSTSSSYTLWLSLAVSYQNHESPVLPMILTYEFTHLCLIAQTVQNKSANHDAPRCLIFFSSFVSSGAFFWSPFTFFPKLSFLTSVLYFPQNKKSSLPSRAR
jgi:hypothetical protein